MLSTHPRDMPGGAGTSTPTLGSGPAERQGTMGSEAQEVRPQAPTKAEDGTESPSTMTQQAFSIVLDEEDDTSFRRWQQKEETKTRKQADYISIVGPKNTYWGPKGTDEEDKKAFKKWWKEEKEGQDFIDVKTIEKPELGYVVPFSVEWTWRVIKLTHTNEEACAILSNWVHKD
ncbi:hypothetical protein IW262DRAFT_1466758 [Armillaria fumosa]|nr:hypothetical protein IW262DRAFT_1466758 [Armillaria fumosa]